MRPSISKNSIFNFLVNLVIVLTVTLFLSCSGGGNNEDDGSDNDISETESEGQGENTEQSYDVKDLEGSWAGTSTVNRTDLTRSDPTGVSVYSGFSLDSSGNIVGGFGENLDSISGNIGDVSSSGDITGTIYVDTYDPNSGYRENAIQTLKGKFVSKEEIEYTADTTFSNNTKRNGTYTAIGTLNKIKRDTDNDLDGYTKTQGDCDDDEAFIHPNAVEIANDGIDQDCNGRDLTGDVNDIDRDKDGYNPNEGDCDDDDASIHPDSTEIMDDGIDQDCDGNDLAGPDDGEIIDTYIQRNDFDSNRLYSSNYLWTHKLPDLPYDANIESVRIELMAKIWSWGNIYPQEHHILCSDTTVFNFSEGYVFKILPSYFPDPGSFNTITFELNQTQINWLLNDKSINFHFVVNVTSSYYLDHSTITVNIAP